MYSMATLNSSFASPVAGGSYASMEQPALGLVGQYLNNLTPWTALLTILVLCVSYDQSQSFQTTLLSRDWY